MVTQSVTMVSFSVLRTLLVEPHEVKWSHGFIWYRGRVETLDAKYNSSPFNNKDTPPTVQREL